MSRLAAVSFGLALLPGAALAHVGHPHGNEFWSGVGHPLGGLDHVIAMLAVGLLGAAFGGRALWALPLSFLLGMALGGIGGAAGLSLPGVEPMILASIIVLGAVLAFGMKIPTAPLAALTAIFGAFHGHAHGSEGPGAGLVLYALGFLVASAALHLAGALIARLGLPQRLLGALTAASGLALTFA
jgi:urease accessory protein